MYSTRRTSNDMTVPLITPPMTTVANGRWTSAPMPVFNAMGRKPRAATNVVMSTGRRRVIAACSTASSRPAPRARSWRAGQDAQLGRAKAHRIKTDPWAESARPDATSATPWLRPIKVTVSALDRLTRCPGRANWRDPMTCGLLNLVTAEKASSWQGPEALPLSCWLRSGRRRAAACRRSR